MSVYDTKEYKNSIKHRVSYEWWVEQWDEHEDIQDCDHIDFKEWPVEAKGECTPRLVLKRYSGSDADGVTDIGHAYVLDGMVELEFCTGHKVPKRYIDQCEKYL
jgi:hypothetical protein